MLLQISSVFNPEEVAKIRAALEAANWLDGKITASWQSGKAKHNQQLAEDDRLAREISELVIQDTFGTQRVKLAAGDLLLYPASSLHRVEPVTRGVRLASFFWTQSMVRDDGKRRLLFEMDQAIQSLTADMPEHPALLQLAGTYHNLLRQWAELQLTSSSTIVSVSVFYFSSIFATLSRCFSPKPLTHRKSSGSCQVCAHYNEQCYWRSCYFVKVFS